MINLSVSISKTHSQTLNKVTDNTLDNPPLLGISSENTRQFVNDKCLHCLLKLRMVYPLS